jgi:N-acetylglucosamine kinase-like BadF-type ATPase
MIALFEAGGTKTELRLGDNKNHLVIPGPGINPYIQDDSEIFLRLEIFFRNQKVDPEYISHVYFFGSGCAHPSQIARVEKLLRHFFPKSLIEVHSDLLGAALALCGTEEGIVGILGTGSNACFFDGSQITKQMVSLGFWLGDEGSGAHLGKQLFKDWLKNRLPVSLEQELGQSFPIQKAQALEYVYADKSPNKTLAALAQVVFKNRDSDYCQNLIFNNIEAYFQEILPLWEGKKNVDFYFTGSVAKELENELQIKIHQWGFSLKTIIPNPSENLFQFQLLKR